MAYGVVRKDNLAGTYDGTKLVSLKYFVGTDEAAIENGMVVRLDGHVSGQREVYKAVTPAANTPLSEVALVASPELIYDERLKNLDDFINEEGKIATGYILDAPGQTFAVTSTVLSGSNIAVGDYVELQADTKLKVVAKTTGVTSGSTKVGVIDAIENTGRYTYYVIRVQ